MNEIWQTIAKNRSRSILTGFGVFWGMMMLLLLVGVGTGFVNGIKMNISGISTNSCNMGTSITSKPYQGMPEGRRWDITTDDIDLLRKEVKEAETICPVSMPFASTNNVRFGEKTGSYYLFGVTPDFLNMVSIKLMGGRYINEVDIRENRKVCVLGYKAYQQLFAGENPVGKMIHIGSMQFRIVGVADKDVREAVQMDEVITMPLSTFQRAYNRGKTVDEIYACTAPGVKAKDMETAIKTVLKRVHRIAPDDERAIWSSNMEEIFMSINYVFIGLQALLWLIGLGTLISGAVGVSNIMMVTVRERTREIGIRRALGASPWLIMRQVLAESVLLTFIAGILGIMAGVGLLNVANKLLPAIPNIPEVDAQISFGLAIGALVIIVLVGVLAGLLPATRALAIKPIEALSEE
ncbi:MAG: ABC transporter permease [Paludibacteraceae bacterium]|nr:ABC transporter permease [Paludibacteraceae bacterium]